jgi:erythronate-4-phosphate dehydrogenase
MSAPKLLCDTAVLDGSACALPLRWLDGFHLVPFAPRDLGSVAGIADTDALLTRTVTKVGAPEIALLRRVRVVATLSSGTDHLDEEALRQREVVLCTGRGGNARAVADWVEWALHRAWGEKGVRTISFRIFAGKRVVVVGVGAVGSEVALRLTDLGADVWPVDPPRAHREPGFRSLDLDRALADGPDAVTLHVPLTTAGPHATANLFDARRLEVCRSVLLNAARGGVIDEQAAADSRRAGRLTFLGLDTWIGEPRPDHAIVAAADAATSHIAGHTVEGKLAVAWRAVAGLRAHFDMAPPSSLEGALAESLQAAPLPYADPFAALDAADRELRAAATAGMSFEPIRHAHRRGQR